MKPDKNTQKELLNAASDPETVYIPDSKDKWVIKNMRAVTLEKLSCLQLGDAASMKDITLIHSRILAKATSYCILNGLKIHLFHWVFWRYLYFWKGYNNEQFEAILKIAKKKVKAKSYSTAILYLSGMKITNLQMTTEEQEQFLQEHSLESGEH